MPEWEKSFILASVQIRNDQEKEQLRKIKK
jgi:hypothetical protein